PSSSSSSSHPGGGGSKGGPPVCFNQTVKVPCVDSRNGWYDSTTACYYTLDPSPPPITNPVWQGKTNSAISGPTSCVAAGWASPLSAPFAPIWLPTPPPTAPPTPAQVAQQAIAKLVMHGPTIGIAPPPTATSYALVGVPVWLWTTDDPQH